MKNSSQNEKGGRGANHSRNVRLNPEVPNRSTDQETVRWFNNLKSNVVEAFPSTDLNLLVEMDKEIESHRLTFKKLTAEEYGSMVQKISIVLGEIIKSQIDLGNPDTLVEVIPGEHYSILLHIEGYSTINLCYWVAMMIENGAVDSLYSKAIILINLVANQEGGHNG